MIVRYPEIVWTERHGVFISEINGFYLRAALRTGGDRAGTWSAIFNHTSLTCGTGDYGYDFKDKDHAISSLERAMYQSIDAKVEQAKQILKEYT